MEAEEEEEGLMEAEEEEEDFTLLTAAAQAQVAANTAVIIQLGGKLPKEDHRRLPRNQRRAFRHDESLACIQRDYLGPSPIFQGKEFETMFRVSRSRFQRLMEDICNTGNPFYATGKTDAVGRMSASIEAKLLLPLKTLAYGVATHCFTDYFQMSKTLANRCCYEFDRVIRQLYHEEYLRLPTRADLRNISRLHKSVHKVDGMFGSLDCMHTTWKNCPKAWQGNFKGKEKHPSIVMEGICDYHLWFWHYSYGYAGTLNDQNILNLSPFLESLTNGQFSDLENQSTVVPFNLSEEEFNYMFILVDGIYPQYS